MAICQYFSSLVVRWSRIRATPKSRMKPPNPGFQRRSGNLHPACASASITRGHMYEAILRSDFCIAVLHGFTIRMCFMS